VGTPGDPFTRVPGPLASAACAADPVAASVGPADQRIHSAALASVWDGSAFVVVSGLVHPAGAGRMEGHKPAGAGLALGAGVPSRDPPPAEAWTNPAG
jgi:hypothetical protein